MTNIYAEVSSSLNFFGKTNPVELIKKYGSPLYVYNENVLRERCRELKNLVDYPNFIVNYSPKANSNFSFLKIVKEEGLHIDAVSNGEIYVCLKAGFSPEQIIFTGNNLSADELQYAIDAKVKICVDSLSQLELFGKMNPGGSVAVRLNLGIGAGHHEKVITGGKKTKFGIEGIFIPQILEAQKKYNIKIIGLHQHIGSLFMDSSSYVEGSESILETARKFEHLEFIDLGGGFGIPYHKQDGQERLNLKELGAKLTTAFNNWAKEYGKQIDFRIEPGRYISAECGILLGTVNAIKINYNNKYIGTDLGFNVIKRPVMYGSHHDIEIYRGSDIPSAKVESVQIVGNICESGDFLAKDIKLPEILENDVIGLLDAGAYGFSMSSNYNNRLKPAEILINSAGDDSVIRQRDTFDDLMKKF
jgi:diaminopimelate decarboxylase